VNYHNGATQGLSKIPHAIPNLQKMEKTIREKRGQRFSEKLRKDKALKKKIEKIMSKFKG